MSLVSRAKSFITRKFGLYPEKLLLSSLALNFKRDYGYLDSRKSNKPIDNHGKPIPWFTYPAIEFLDSLDLRTATIFEWGSGHSSAYFAARCSSIESIESDRGWFEYQQGILKPNQSVRYRAASSEDYCLAIKESDLRKYDIIIVDGMQRVRCCEQAIAKLKDGAILILDNSDWYPKLCQSLRTSGLIQIDFHGHGPINPYTWSTSFFVMRMDACRADSLLSKKASPSYWSRSGLVQIAEDDGPIA